MQNPNNSLASALRDPAIPWMGAQHSSLAATERQGSQPPPYHTQEINQSTTSLVATMFDSQDTRSSATSIISHQTNLGAIPAPPANSLNENENRNESAERSIPTHQGRREKIRFAPGLDFLDTKDRENIRYGATTIVLEEERNIYLSNYIVQTDSPLLGMDLGFAPAPLVHVSFFTRTFFFVLHSLLSFGKGAEVISINYKVRVYPRSRTRGLGFQPNLYEVIFEHLAYLFIFLKSNGHRIREFKVPALPPYKLIGL